MKIIINKRAQNTLNKVAEWIAEEYFLDTAVKWLDEFDDVLHKIAKPNVKYALCNNPNLARYQYSCLTFKEKWVIAYKITPTTLTVYRFIFGARLK